MTLAIGLDLGSRRTKAVLVEDGRIRESGVFESWALEKAVVIDWVERHGEVPAAPTGNWKIAP